MRPFTMFNSISEFLPIQSVSNLVREIVEPDKIFLLGATLHRRRCESIFYPDSPTARYISDYFILILVPAVSAHNLFELQEKVERHCKDTIPVTAIALKTDTFVEWIKTGHRFTRFVLDAAETLFDSGGVELPKQGNSNAELEIKACEKYYCEGLNRMEEFLAGANLYMVRKQNKMAAFMLHQSIEQALLTIIKTATGYHCHTHNISRLIQYGSMVAYNLPDIFPSKTESDKQLLGIVQKAYIEARYDTNYSIPLNSLVTLTEKARRLREVLELTSKNYICANPARETKPS